MSLKKQVSLHGTRAFIDKDDILVGKGGVASGGEGSASVLYPGPDTVAIFEDFHYDSTYHPAMTTVYGADTGVISYVTGRATGVGDSGESFGPFIRKSGGTGVTTTILEGNNGVLRMATTTQGTATAVGGGTALMGNTYQWEVRQGPSAQSGRLRIGARVRRSDWKAKATDGAGRAGIFVGFTDTGLGNAHLHPYYDTGATQSGLYGVSNMCGIAWNSRGDTGFVGVGSKGGANPPSATGLQRVVLTTDSGADLDGGKWVDLELEIHRGVSDTGGTATFYVNGQARGNITSPITSSRRLSPTVAMYDTGGTVTFDVDWIAVSAPRDTGT